MQHLKFDNHPIFNLQPKVKYLIINELETFFCCCVNQRLFVDDSTFDLKQSTLNFLLS